MIYALEVLMFAVVTVAGAVTLLALIVFMKAMLEEL